MTQISSDWTFFYKRVFPVLWFGFLAVFVCLGGATVIAERQWAALFLLVLMPLIMAIVGYVLMKWIILDLVDEVWDCGDSILVRNKGVERRFALSDFTNLSYTGYLNPPRITLTLREPSADFGSEVAFTPPFRLFHFSMPPIARDLMKRIDQARRQS